MEITSWGGVLLDGFLSLVILFLAWRLLTSKDLFKAVVLFIGFGLVMSLAWIRLRAIDIAMAEAAIGAGLTGALFLSALHRMRRTGDPAPDTDEEPDAT